MTQTSRCRWYRNTQQIWDKMVQHGEGRKEYIVYTRYAVALEANEGPYVWCWWYDKKRPFKTQTFASHDNISNTEVLRLLADKANELQRRLIHRLSTSQQQPKYKHSYDGWPKGVSTPPVPSTVSAVIIYLSCASLQHIAVTYSSPW